MLPYLENVGLTGSFTALRTSYLWVAAQKSEVRPNPRISVAFLLPECFFGFKNQACGPSQEWLLQL